MARRPSTFRHLCAAIKAAKAAGCEVAHIEVDPVSGKIVVMTIAGGVKEPTTDLDKWLAKHADSAERA